MTRAQWRYYIINSLLVSGKFPAVPKEYEDTLDGLNTSEVETALMQLAPLELTKVEGAFLSYLRTPDYPMCIASGSGNIMTIAMIADHVRRSNGEITVEGTASWAAASILEVRYESVIHPEVRDAVLILPLVYQTQPEDLVKAMDKAYALYCWGIENPTADQRDFVNWCVEFVSPTKSLTMKAGAVHAFVTKCQKTGLSPVRLSQSVLFVSNLSKTIKQAGVPCWWSTVGHQLVSLMLPQGSGDVLAHAKIPVESFRQLVTAKDGLVGLHVKGGRILLGGETK